MALPDLEGTEIESAVARDSRSGTEGTEPLPPSFHALWRSRHRTGRNPTLRAGGVHGQGLTGHPVGKGSD